MAQRHHLGQGFSHYPPSSSWEERQGATRGEAVSRRNMAQESGQLGLGPDLPPPLTGWVNHSTSLGLPILLGSMGSYLPLRTVEDIK